MTAERFAIVGANGFLGGHFTRFAAGAGHEVVGIVRSDEAARRVIDGGGRPAKVEGFDVSGLARAFEGCRAAVHLANISAERGRATYENVNLLGLSRVIEAAQKAGLPRVVLFSGLGVAHYGLAPRCTNPYFLAKLAAEVELYRSGLEAVVFRPSYILGPDDELIPALLDEMAGGEVERVGDGAYRMQPIAVKDVAELVLAVIRRENVRHLVVDLVGPEPISYAAFLDRVAGVAAGLGQPTAHRIREVPIEEADGQAAAGGYRGLLPDELDVLLCDEVGDPRVVEALLGRFLTPLDEAVAAAVRGSKPRRGASFRRA